jgi:uncharacterized protein (TIGR03067 family)
MISFAVLFSAAMLAAAEQADKPTAEQSDAQAAEQSLLGHWDAQSVTLSTSTGENETFGETGAGKINATFSEKTMTLQVGTQKFAEMTYKLDPQQTPAIIDASYGGKDLLGIYKFEGDTLLIRLNDAQAGRPKAFEGKAAGISMDLQRIDSHAILFMDANGVELESLQPLTEYSTCGSPRWSRDGSKIVYDAWRTWCGENYVLSHVIVINPDGTSLKDLGRGALPAISPDSKKITFCQYDDNRGVWVMNIDGSEKKLIDAEGWCSDWTSNNDEIIYTTDDNDGANLRVTNINTGKSRLLLSKHKFQQIFWGLGCSQDGKWIAFQGIKPNGESQLAIVGTEGKDQGFKVLLPNDAAKDVTEYNRYVSWTPDNKHVLALMCTKERPNQQLYYLDVEGKDPPQWLSGQESYRIFYCSTISHDGKKIVTIATPMKKAAMKKEN